MRYLLPLVLLAVSFGGGLSAQQPAPRDGPTPTELTPEEAVRLALQNNRRIGAARAGAAGARAAFRQVQASRLPALHFRSDYRRLVGDLPDPEFGLPGFEPDLALFRIPRDQVNTELSLEQPIFEGGALRNRALAAEHEADAAALLVDQEEADVAFAVRSAYWDLHRALAVHEAAHAAVAQLEAHLRDLEMLFEEGVILRSDLLAARTRRSEARLDALEAEDDVRAARLELAWLIGAPLDEELHPTPDPTTPLEPLEEELGELVERAQQDRPQLRALDEQRRAVERRVGAARGAWLPQVSLVARYTYGRPNPLVLTEMDAFRGIGEAGVLLRWSVFQGGRRPARTAQARAELTAAEEQFADARDGVAVEVTRLYHDALRAEEMLAVAEEHAEEAEESFRVIREQFEDGVVLSSRVLEAEQVYRAAQARHAGAVAGHAVARAALLHALGEVW